MGIEENKEVVRQFIERTDNGDISTIDELTTNNFVFRYYGANPPEEFNKEQLKQVGENSSTAKSDKLVTIEDIVAEGDRVVTRVTEIMKHTGKLLNVESTGKTITNYRFNIWRLEGGEIAEVWALNNQLFLFQQMGVLPPTREIANLKGA